MAHYEWKTLSVKASGLQDFTTKLGEALNTLEQEGFEIDEIMDPPGGRQTGVVVVGRKPKLYTPGARYPVSATGT